MKILLYGYGNPGRQDDGLGNAFIDRMEAWVEEKGLEGFEFDSNYQLNIEDADAVADKDIVIFADASTEEIEDFCVTKIDEGSKMSFTTHAASPAYIMDLNKKLFKTNPLGILLHMKGYTWEFQEGLSEQALENLEKAVTYFQEKFSDMDKLQDPEYLIKNCN